MSPRILAGTRGDARLAKAQNAWQLRVLALEDIDPVTTEVIRVRAAGHHRCHT